jgi:hypothetical protein
MSAASVVNRNGIAGPIDEQLFSSLVLLARHDILFAAPALIKLAEAGVAIAVRVGLPVLLLQQLLRHMCMLLPLPMKVGEVWQRPPSGQVMRVASARCRYS